MLIPAIFEERAAAARRVPPQSGQAVKVAARSTNARMCGWRPSRSFEKNDFCTFATRPSKVRFIAPILTFVGSLWRKSASSVGE